MKERTPSDYWRKASRRPSKNDIVSHSFKRSACTLPILHVNPRPAQAYE